MSGLSKVEMSAFVSEPNDLQRSFVYQGRNDDRWTINDECSRVRSSYGNQAGC